MKRAILWVFGVVFVLLLLLPLVSNSNLFRAALSCLPLGWLHFLKRNVPQLTWNWSLIGMVFVCSAILLFLGNRQLSALYGQIQQRGADRTGTPWRWQWTASLYIALWLVFVTAFAAAGVFRHTTWLMEEQGPWYEERLNSYNELRVADGTIQQLLLENGGDLKKTQKALQAEGRWRYNSKVFCEEFEVIFYGNSNGQLETYVLIPRNPQLLKKGHFFVFPADQPSVEKPISELEHTIAELDAKYPGKQ